MDAFVTAADNLAYSDLPPVLVAASCPAGFARARPAIEAAGMRVADTVLMADAEARLDRQAAASALWVEIDQDGGPTLDALLAKVNRDVADGRYAAIVATSTALSTRCLLASTRPGSKCWSMPTTPSGLPPLRSRSIILFGTSASRTSGPIRMRCACAS